MPTVYGVDLGAHTIKISTMEGSFGRFQLVDYRTHVVPQSVSEPPTLERRLSVASTILDQMDIDRAQYACAYPAEATSIRVIALPFADKNKINQTLGFVIGDYVPFDMDTSVLAHRILDIEHGESRVLTAIAPMDSVQQRLVELNGAGIEPSSLCVDSDLLSSFATNGVQAILDIGHERTLMALAIDGEMKISRAHSGGGRDLTLAIAKNAGVDWQTAEGRKHIATLTPDEQSTPAEAGWEQDEQTEPGAEPPNNDTQVLLNALRPWLQHIRTTLIHFEDTLDVEVDEVIVMGGGSQLNGLRAHLTEELGVPVRTAQVPQPQDLVPDPPRLALAYALGERAAKMGNTTALNLRSGQLAFQGDLANIGLWMQIGVLVAVAMLMVSTGWFAYRYAQLSAEIEDTEALIAREAQAAFPDMGDSVAGDPSRAVAVVAEFSANASLQVETLGSILSDVPPTLELYRRVVQGMPNHTDARVDVSELTITTNSVFFKAETDGFEEATRIEAALQNQEGFEGANKGDEKRDRQGNVDFSVTIPLGTTEDGEEG